MKRIGIAASKIAQGNVVLYNLYVVLISFLFSLIIFMVAGTSVFFALFMIDNLTRQFASIPFHENRSFIFMVCMISLTILVFLFNLYAISLNLKFRRRR